MSQYLGDISAYALAVSQGYTGTEEEYAELMASYATVGQTAVTAAQTATTKASEAATSATTAANKASEATTAATTATTKAGEASTSASTATSAKDTAVSASQTATSKATEATTAAATATSAASTATTAKDDAVSAKTAAQTAQTGAETAAASVSASAAQIATNAADISQLKSDLTSIENGKANTDGYYEDLVSGGSTQLLSDMVATDTTPYNYRTAGGSLEIGDREKLKKIVGGSLAVNQLIQDGDFIVGTTWDDYQCSHSVINGVVTITPTSTISRIYQAKDVVLNHKYLMMASFKGTAEEGNAKLSWYGGVNIFVPFNGDWQNVALLLNNSFQTAPNWQLHYGSSANQNSTPYQIKNAVCFDLTTMFGTTIADYVYSLETATAGAGVAWLKAHFPKIFDSGYIPYNAGTLEHVSGLSAHKMTGFNQWDEEWETGKISESTGANVASNNTIRSKNFIPVISGASYFFRCDGIDTNNQGFFVYGYDADKNYLGYFSVNKLSNPKTIPDNYSFIRFRMYDPDYGTTYKNDICINLHWDGERDGEYEPYEEHSYPLDSDVTLRGIYKLDANNQLYADGDEYEADGTVTRKYGIVDLGELGFVYESSIANKHFFVPSNFFPEKPKYRGELLSTIYAGTKKSYQNIDNMEMCVDNSVETPVFRIRNDAYTSASDFKSAMSGVMLVYELATPTTESADPYTEIQNVSNWGTEEFVTTSLVPVGHETAYQPDLRAKIEVAPESPDTDGMYLMKRENGQNSYVAYLGELPSDPTTDGTYTLKCTVSGGTATKTWEADT